MEEVTFASITLMFNVDTKIETQIPNPIPPPPQPQPPPHEYKELLDKDWPRLSATAQIVFEEAPGRKDVSTITMGLTGTVMIIF